MNHNQIYNPYIEESPTDPTDVLFHRALAVIVVFMAALLVSHFSGCASAAQDEEAAVETAFFPSAPSHAQQVAYQEEAREDLRLRTMMAAAK